MPNRQRLLRTVAVTISHAASTVAHLLPGFDGETARRNAWEAMVAARERRQLRDHLRTCARCANRAPAASPRTSARRFSRFGR